MRFGAGAPDLQLTVTHRHESVKAEHPHPILVKFWRVILGLKFPASQLRTPLRLHWGSTSPSASPYFFPFPFTTIDSKNSLIKASLMHISLSFFPRKPTQWQISPKSPLTKLLCVTNLFLSYFFNSLENICTSASPNAYIFIYGHQKYWYHP